MKPALLLLNLLEMYKAIKSAAFSLVEVILAVTLFGLFAAIALPTAIGASIDASNSEDQLIASYYLQEAEEALHSIRDYDWLNVCAGVHGLSTSNGYWELLGSNDSYEDFTRSITLTELDTDTYEAVINVTWTTIEGVNRSMTTTTRVTDHQRAASTTDSCDTPSVGAQADDLVVDTSGVNLSSNGKIVQGITIENIGSSDITIDTMTLSWVSSSGGTKLKTIVINSTSVWSGNANSGVVADISDFTLTAGAGTYNINSIEFSKSMLLALLDITFTMSDGSTKSVTGIAL